MAQKPKPKPKSKPVLELTFPLDELDTDTPPIPPTLESVQKDDTSTSDYDEPTEESMLLFTHWPGPRIFSLNNSTSNTMVGVLMEENDDSFLVALPSVLIQNQKTRAHSIEAFIPIPYFRLMKSAVVSVLYPFGIIGEYYIDYLIKNGVELYPEIEDLVLDLIEIRNEAEGSLSTEAIDSVTKMLENDDDDNEEDKVTPGRTEEELRQYLLDKYLSGGVIMQSGRKQ